TDSTGVQILRMAHDVRGRLEILNDRDLGDIFEVWNAFDELTSEQDGNSLYKTYVHDGRGRIQTITDKDGTATFVWDTAAHGVGMLASATSTGGYRTSYAYDSVGRITNTETDIGNAHYNLGIAYDPSGRVDTVTYPGSSS